MTSAVFLIFSIFTAVAAPVQAVAAGFTLAQADIGKSRAAEAALRAYGGKVLSVEKGSENGRVVYRVKLLLEGGRIKIVAIDGETGQAV